MKGMGDRRRRLAGVTAEKLARDRLVLLAVLHDRFDAMPTDTQEQKITRVYKFIKYAFKYPHGIAHPELFEE